MIRSAAASRGASSSGVVGARSIRAVLGFGLVACFVWFNASGPSRSSLHDDESWQNVPTIRATEATTAWTAPETPPKNYAEWRELALQLARLSPDDALDVLRTQDPFQTREFARRLADAEADNGGPLTIEAFTLLFGGCPASSRLSVPDQRDHTKAASFRQGADKYFLYFQHLRKAGGTHFCTVVNDNLPKANTPPYFCMPDKAWSWENKTKINPPRAGRLHHWSNEEILQNMGPYKIASNEWDSFDPAHHFELPAVLVTNFRKPVDRAVSQFRFECVERHLCKTKNVMTYWRKRKDLHNVYTWTFSNIRKQASFATDTSDESAEQRGNAVGAALDTVVRFHAVLAMEWLAYADSTVRTVLGFDKLGKLTKTVRPHNRVKKRQDTWKSHKYLTADEYQEISQSLALDEILTDAANRLFLERLTCNDL